MLSVKQLSSTELKQNYSPHITTSSNSVFDDINWFFLLEKHVFKQPEHNCYYLTVFEIDEPVLILPLFTANTNNHSSLFRLNEMESTSNYYSTYFSPPSLGKQQDLRPAYAALAKYIKQEIKTEKITLKPFIKGSDTYQHVVEMLSNAGFYVFPYFMHGNWLKEISTESFEKYYASLSTRLKNTIKRKDKKLIKELGDYRIDIIDKNTSSLEKYISDYEAIYEKSWKQSEPHDEFIRDIIKLHASTGSLKLGMLYLNEQPLAAQIWFIKNQTAYIFKLAYDPEYKQYSVGSILSKALFLSAIDEDQIKVIDYLTGDDNYKQDWMDQRRELWGLEAYNGSSIKGISCAIYEKLKRFLKRS